MNRIGILGNAERDRTPETLRTLLHILASTWPESEFGLSKELDGMQLGGFEQQESNLRIFENPVALAEHSDIIFSIGGDGTMLAASRAIMRGNPKVRLIGVNVGKLGFLSENPPLELPQLIQELKAGLLRSEERLMLQANVVSEKGGEHVTELSQNLGQKIGRPKSSHIMNALNEIVIDNYGSTRMLTLEVYVDGSLLGTMRADGMIVATPTGSTGYAVSAGGPIIEPTTPVMLITPIAPHSLNVRPIIVPEKCDIVVRARSDETKQALIVADGQEEIIVDTPASVSITAAPERLHLLRRSERSYFDLLRQKLLWSMDQREHGRF